MTTENHAEDLQTTTPEGEGIDGEEGEQPPAEDLPQDGAGETQPPTDGKVAEQPQEQQPEPKTGDDALKRTRDTLSRVRNDQVQSYRIIKAFEADGTYTREEMAEKSGIPIGEVNRLLDTKPTATPGEPEYETTLINAFAEDIKNPVLMKALERAYGGPEVLKELKAAYEWAHRNDPSVQANLANVGPEEMTVHVFDTGKEFLDEYREANGRTPLQMLREAKKAFKTEQAAPGKTETAPRHPRNAEQPMPTLEQRMPPPAAPADPAAAWVARLSQ